MNLPPPVTKSNYHKISNKFRDSQIVAEDSMSADTCEVKKECTSDIGISIDGTWESRSLPSPKWNKWINGRSYINQL